MSRQEAMDASSAFAAMGIPMMERQLVWPLRRILEHNAFQLIVEHVENSVEAAVPIGRSTTTLEPRSDPSRRTHTQAPHEAGGRLPDRWKMWPSQSER